MILWSARMLIEYGSLRAACSRFLLIYTSFLILISLCNPRRLFSAWVSYRMTLTARCRKWLASVVPSPSTLLGVADLYKVIYLVINMSLVLSKYNELSN